MPIPFSFNVIIDNFIVVVYLPSHVLLFCNPKCVACQPPHPWHLLSLARILEWFPYSSPGDLPDPGAEPASPAFVGGFFITEPPGQPITDICCCCLVAKLFPILCDSVTVACQAPLAMRCPRQEYWSWDFPNRRIEPISLTPLVFHINYISLMFSITSAT